MQEVPCTGPAATRATTSKEVLVQYVCCHVNYHRVPSAHLIVPYGGPEVPYGVPYVVSSHQSFHCRIVSSYHHHLIQSAYPNTEGWHGELSTSSLHTYSELIGFRDNHFHTHLAWPYHTKENSGTQCQAPAQVPLKLHI